MLYLVDNADKLCGETYAQTLALLPADRRARAERCVHEGDRQRIVVAWLLLRHALREEYNLPDVPPLACGPRGKPFFAAPGLPHFNLSHSGHYAACALSPVEVGVDVQATADAARHLSPALVRRTCSPAEIARLEAAGPADSPAYAQAFCALWTRKESVIKLTGRGLAEPLPNLLEHHAADVLTTTATLNNGDAFLSLSRWAHNGTVPDAPLRPVRIPLEKLLDHPVR